MIAIALIGSCSSDVSLSTSIDGCYTTAGEEVAEINNGRLLSTPTGKVLALVERYNNENGSFIRLSKTVEIANRPEPAIEIVDNKPMYTLFRSVNGSLTIILPRSGGKYEISELVLEKPEGCSKRR
jgi:hypothetical protein